MFTITCDGKILMDLKKHIVLTSPKLEMEENAAGSLSFDMAPEHPLFDAIEMMVSEIIVYRDGVEIWSGRPVEVHTSFLGVRSIYCEGALAYLCDTVQEPSETHDDSIFNIQNWLGMLLNRHNAKAPASRRFYVGTVTVLEPDTLYRYTNYETTIECINEKLIKRLGGHLRIRRRAAGGFYLDYLEDYPHTAQQTIRFGLNLLEYSRTLTRADIATVCLPLGTRLEEKDFQALDKYLDIKEVNDGSLYVESPEGIAAFGRIIKVVHWDDVATPQTLKSKAQKWLSDAQYDDLKLEVNALDFHLADNAVPAIEMLDEVRVVSPPHGLDKYYPVTKINIPLDSPADMVFTLGTSERVSLTTKTNAAISAIDEDLEYLPSSILLQAKNNATELITTGALGGHVVILPDEIYVSDKDDIDAAKKMWRWNLAGLGYSKTGRNGEFGTAITMDGKIVADYITTGLMSADRMRGGTLALGGTAYKDGKIEVHNASGEIIGRWNVEGLTVTKGRISGTGITLGGSGAPGSITVNNAQNEPIGYWTVNGITIKKGSISGSSLTVGGKESGGTGSITIKSDTDVVLGTFNKNGITIKKGTISGAALTLGGSGSGTGSITVKDSSDNTIGSWSRTGLSVLKGAISGTSISGSTITGTKVSLGGKTGGDGALTVYDADGTQIGKWDKNGINLSKSTIKGGAISGGTIKGSAISGSTITGGTVTGSKLIAGGSSSGTITVQDASGNTIGSWTKSGLTVKKGSITGASITVGGKSNGNGTIIVKDSTNTTVGKWDNTGVTIKQGSITGGTIQGPNIYTGGSGNKNGAFRVYDSSNNLAGRWDKDGLYLRDGMIESSYGFFKLGSISGKSGTSFWFGTGEYAKTHPDFALYKTGDNWTFDGFDGSGVHIVSSKTSFIGESRLRLNDGISLLFTTNNNVSSGVRFQDISSMGVYGEWTASQTNVYGKVYFQSEDCFINLVRIATVSSSSERYKQRIEAISDKALDPHKLLRLPVRQFEYNEGIPLQYKDMQGMTLPGFIAEEVDKIYPAATIHNSDGSIESWDERRIIPGMLALIQEQENRITALEGRIYGKNKTA